MERQKKIFLLVVGGVLLASSIGFGIYLHLKKKNEEAENNDTGTDPNNPNSTTATGTQPTPETEPVDNMVRPQFNVENELSNPLSQIKGKYLYPKRTAQGGWGYANIRTSAVVNTDQGWWDPSDNLITTINSGTPIGKVLSETTGVYNNYSYRWFKVKLYKSVAGWFSDYTEGYVRADTVTFKPY